MTDDVTLGEVAYTAYGRTTDFKNYQGLPMPAWQDLGDTIRAAWENAAKAVKGATSSPQILASAQARANYGDVWTELTGYVQEAVEDGGVIDPAHMLGYMRELKQRALAPVREWMNSVGRERTDG